MDVWSVGMFAFGLIDSVVLHGIAWCRLVSCRVCVCVCVCVRVCLRAHGSRSG